MPMLAKSSMFIGLKQSSPHEIKTFANNGRTTFICRICWPIFTKIWNVLPILANVLCLLGIVRKRLSFHITVERKQINGLRMKMWKNYILNRTRRFPFRKRKMIRYILSADTYEKHGFIHVFVLNHLYFRTIIPAN